MVLSVKLAKWSRRGPTAAGDGFESCKNSKSFEKKLKNSFFATISHSYYIDRPDEFYHSNKRLLVKGESHIRPTGVQTPDPERGSVQSGQKEKEKREMWYVSRHYEPRTEVWRGGTPKVRKL